MIATAEETRDQKFAVVDRELAKIYERNKEPVSPEVLLQEAKRKNHPLHCFFEWNNGVAGDLFRRDQALRMIMASRYLDVLKAQRSVLPTRISVVVSPKPPRAWLPMPGHAGFAPRQKVLTDEHGRKQEIEKRIQILRTWIRESQDIRELDHLRHVIMKEVQNFEA